MAILGGTGSNGDPLLITDTLASPNGETEGQTDYEGAGPAAGDLEYALTELDTHAPRYIEAQLYAQGRSPELFFLSEQARRDVIAFIDGFRFNFAGLVVATIADRMILNAVDGIDGTNTEEFVLESNELYTWMPEAIYDTLIDGDHYIVTLPPADDGESPVMVPSNAIDTRLFYDDETSRIPTMGIRRWAVGRSKDRRVRANLWYRDRVERFVREPDGRWKPYSDLEAGLAEREAADFIPFAHLRTRAPYGRPIHADAYGPQDAIVKAIMTLMASTEFTGWPQRYALHEENLLGQTGMPTRTPGTPQAGQKPRLRSGPGTVWDVFAKQVGAFPAADLDKLISVASFAVRGMSQVTRIPMHYFDPAGGYPSGESLIAADQPVKASANRQKGNVGRGLVKAVNDVAKLAGDSVDPEAVWAPDPVISDLTWWQTAEIKSREGVPTRQILMEAGYTPDQIDEFERENRRRQIALPSGPPNVDSTKEIQPPTEGN